MALNIRQFNLLLNRLSDHLDQSNLRSLIHICEDYIPGAQREKINNGLEFFRILSHQNKIGEEPDQMKFLLKIIREMRPKRKDLVKKVERYIQENYEQPETILEDFETSSEVDPSSRPGTPPPPLQFFDAECCNVRCGCFNCNCNPCCGRCCCCVILAISCGFFAVIAALVWYSNIFPQVVEDYLRNHDLNRVGPIVIGILGFIAVCCVLCGVYLQRNRLVYAVLPSVNDARNILRASNSTLASCATYDRYINRPRRGEQSQSSGHVTASNSMSSIYTAGQLTPPFTDGFSQQDVFSTESEEDHSGRGRDGGGADQV